MRALALLTLAALGACSATHGVTLAPAEEPVRETYHREHPGGARASERQVLVHADGQSERDGFEREFSPEGRLLAERFFAHDVPCGTWREWYPDGTPRAETEFGTGGTQELLPSRYWHSSGKLAAEGSTRAGLREGEWNYWDAEGRLLRSGGHRAGLRDGDWLFLRPDGSKEAAGRYAQGQRVGEWTLWDEAGVPHARAAAETREP